MEKNAKEGYGKVLGRLEQEILDVLWKSGPLNGKEIFSDIRHKRDIALTTVLTVLERLAKKGLVRKTRGESVYLFEAAYSREGFAREVSQEVLKSIFDISRSGACASFVDMLARVDPVELEELSSMIEKKKKELESITKG
ncbi:MAG: BlaI/MecI/CopY family transcriptional regulator [Deltaproteobacteria bacterium]|nr:BlaI/MecI/CopY family transcriptional regulator [Deltaproteobacteria bacterium]